MESNLIPNRDYAIHNLHFRDFDVIVRDKRLVCIFKFEICVDDFISLNKYKDVFVNNDKPTVT